MRFLPLLLCLAAVPALARDADAPATGTARPGPPRWTLGLIAIERDAPYRGLDEGLLLVPLVRFEGERAYLRGLRGGLRLVDTPAFELAAFAQARMDGYDARDSTFLAGMADRERSLDLGLAADWRTPLGAFELALSHDALDRSGGAEAALSWGLSKRLGRWTLLPALALRWQDAELADYYYGVRTTEATPARPAYAPGSALTPELSLLASRPLSARWTLFARAGHSRYPAAIADSPIVGSGDGTSVMLGLGYSPEPE